MLNGKWRDQVNSSLFGINLLSYDQRVAELGEFSTEFQGKLLHMKQAQESMQIKVADLELRSRSNNIRIYGIPEAGEENNPMEFVANFLRSELALGDIDLKVQRCQSFGSATTPARAAEILCCKFPTEPNQRPGVSFITVAYA